jgi:hypothetical protein
VEVSIQFIRIAVLVLTPLLLLWLSFGRKVRGPRWSRISARIISAISALPLIALGLFLLSARGCEEDRPLVGSPDGKQVARLMIWGSVPSGTSLEVIERRSWSPTWQVVSTAASIGTPLEPIHPEINWSDNDHLVLDYPESAEGTEFDCTSRKVGDIWLVCKTHK